MSRVTSGVTSGMMWIRVLLGALWLGAGLEKLLNPEFPVLLDGVFSAGGFVDDAPSWFQSFMSAYAAPNPELFAHLVGFGELALGVGLIPGLLTNLNALGGTILGMTFFTALGGIGIGSGLGSPGIITFQALVAILSLLVLLCPSAKAASVDGFLASRRPWLRPLLLSTFVPPQRGGSTPRKG